MRGNLIWEERLHPNYVRFEEDENGEYEMVDGGRITQHQNGQAKQSQPERPPLGIIPRWILAEQRITEIQEAQQRFRDADKSIPIEWSIELSQLLDYMINHEAKQSQPEDNPEREVLFTTDDGVKIYRSDRCWGVMEDFHLVEIAAYHDRNEFFERFIKIFSLKEKAEEYIRDNKPVFSVNDIIKNSIKVTLTDKNDDVFIPKSQLIFMAKEKLKQ